MELTIKCLLVDWWCVLSLLFSFFMIHEINKTIVLLYITIFVIIELSKFCSSQIEEWICCMFSPHWPRCHRQNSPASDISPFICSVRIHLSLLPALPFFAPCLRCSAEALSPVELTSILNPEAVNHAVGKWASKPVAFSLPTSTSTFLRRYLPFHVSLTFSPFFLTPAHPSFACTT